MGYDGSGGTADWFGRRENVSEVKSQESSLAPTSDSLLFSHLFLHPQQKNNLESGFLKNIF